MPRCLVLDRFKCQIVALRATALPFEMLTAQTPLPPKSSYFLSLGRLLNYLRQRSSLRGLDRERRYLL